jgi:hypothetical protein
MEGGAVGHNFERDTLRDHLCQVWTLHRCFLPSLAPFGQAVSEEKIFLTLAGNGYLPLKFASVSFYCQVSDTGSVGWASSFFLQNVCDFFNISQSEKKN